MNLSKKLKYSVLLPIIAFMAVAIALCACIGIKGADVETTAEAASMTMTLTEQPGHTHDDLLGVKFFDISTLAGITELSDGSYGLTAGTNLTSDITINGTVNLCIKGNYVPAAGYKFIISAGSVLNLYACEDGSITFEEGGNITVYGTLNLYGGSVYRDRARENVIVLSGTSASVALYGGSVDVSIGGEEEAYGICAPEAGQSVKLAAGAVNSVRTATTIDAAGYTNSFSVKFDGIENGTVVATGITTSNVYFSDYESMNNFRLVDGVNSVVANRIYTVSIFHENATPISGEVNQTITPGDPMTEVQLSAYEGYYFPDTFTQDGITFTNNGDGTATVSGTPTKSVMINASAKLPTHKHGTTEFDTVLTSEMIMNFASMGDSSTKSVPTGNYYLLSDIAPDCILVVESGATVNICLNGFTMSKVKIIVAGGTLGIYDCSEASTGSITGMDMGNVISVNAGTLNLYSGKISGNGASSDWDPEKAALYVNGTFNMYGGTVSSKKYNSFDEYAVAIYVTNNINLENGTNFGGTFNISGGTVTERVVIIRAYYKDETTEITHDPNPIDASGYTASAPIDLWLENPIAGVVAVNNGNVSDWHILNNGFRLEKEGDNLVVKGSPKYKVTINLSEGYEIDPSLGLGVEVLEQYVAKGEEITKVVLKVKTGYYKTDTTIVTTFNGVTVYHYDSQSVLVYGSTTEDIQIDISNVSAVPVADAHAHDGMYFATDLNANFAANQNAYGNDTDSFFTKKVIVYGTTECDKNTGAATTEVARPSEEVTGLALYRECTVEPYSTNEGRFYEIKSDYHYELSGGTYYLSEDLDLSERYGATLIIQVNGTVKICLNGHNLKLAGDAYFQINSGGLTICDCGEGKVTTQSNRFIYSESFEELNVSLQNFDIESTASYSSYTADIALISIPYGYVNISDLKFTFNGTKGEGVADKLIFAKLDSAYNEYEGVEKNFISVGKNVSIDSRFYFYTGVPINMNEYNNANPIYVKRKNIRVGSVIAENATVDMVEIYGCDPYVDLARGTNVVAIIPWGIDVTLNNVSLDAVDGGGALSQTDLRDVAMTTIYLKVNGGYLLPISLALPSGLVYTVSEDKLTATISGKPTDDQVEHYGGTPIAVTVNGKEYVEPHIHDGITFDLVMDADLLVSLSEGVDEITYQNYKILTAGNYFLNGGNISLTTDIRIFGQVNICLNGNNIVCGEYRFVLAANASLNIYGCKGGAFVKNGYSIFADNAGTSLGVHGGNAGRIVTVNPIDVNGYNGTVNVLFRNLTSGTTVLTNGTKDNLSLINAGSFDIREEGVNVVVYVYGSVTITLVGIELADDKTGALEQTNLLGAMTPVKVKAIDGKFLPDSVSTKNGIVYTNNGDGTATISGTPSGDVSYALAAFDSAEGHVHDGVTFDTALTLDYLNNCFGDIDAGNYYLAEDIIWYGSLRINGAVNICLNGNKFRYACTGDSIYVGNTGTLGIYGCCGGELTNTDNFYQYLLYVEGGRFNLFGGTVSSIREKVINLTNGASFTMTGGSVINNYTSTEYINIEQQVSVYANSGSAVKITNGTVKGKLYVWNAIDLDGYAGEAIPLYNGNITKGCVLANNAVNADVISLINDGYMQDYVADNKTIIAAETYTVTINLVNAKLASDSEGALYQKVKVGEPFKPVTLDILGNYDETASEIDGTYFKFNLNEDGTVATIMPTENTVSYPNQYYIKVVASIPHKHNDITFTALNSDGVYNSFIIGGNYYLTSDVDWAINDRGFTVRNNLSICLNGYSITIRGMYPQITVANGAALRIFDCNESGKGSIRFYREYVSDTSSLYDTSAINIGYGLLEIYGGTFLFTYENYVIGGINVGGMSNDGENWVYGNIAVYGGNLKNFLLNSDGYCIRGNSANNNIKISGGTLGKVYVKSAIEADGYDGNALSVYYGEISNGVTVLKNSTVDKLNLLNDGYFAKQSGTDVIAVPPKTVTVTLEHASATDAALLTQTVGSRITDIVITAEDGYVLPATLDIGYGLTYTLAPDGLTATISGEPTADTTITVTCEVADSRTPVDIPSAGSKDYTGETLISDLVDTELYTVTTNAGGIGAGEYDVELTLIDNTSYKWATGDADDAVRTIKFVINKATNEWTTALDMADWTYGTTASDPVAEAEFGTVVFTYATAQDGTYSNVKPVNAGTYWVKATVEGTDNYTALIDTKSFVIATVKVAKPEADSTVFTYDGTEKTYTVAANDAYTVSGNKQTNAGNHTVTIALIDKNNYEWTTAGNSDDLTYAFNIGKIDYDMSGITFESATVVYDGQAHSLTISGTLPTGLDGITVTVSYTGSATSVSEGAVTVTATFATDSVNYNVPEAKTATITITQATNAWTTSLDMAGWTYGNTASDPVAEAEFGAVAFAYATTEDGVYESAKPVNAGTYWVKATVAETADYTGLTAKKSFVIDTVKVAKPEADSTVFTYDGTEKTYTVASNAAYSVSNNTRTLAGSQTVTVALIDADNYEWADGTTADVEFTFTINKAQIAKPAADETEFTYNKAEQIYTVATNAAYAVNNNTRTLAGSQTVTVALNDKDNYEWADGTTADVTFDFVIAKAVVDVPSAGSKEYTGSLLQSDIADTADYTVTKNDGGTSVGYYDVVVELIDNGNYKWNDDGEEVAKRTIQFRITKKLNRFTVELSMDNWTYGKTAKEPLATALIGTVAFTYSNEENGTYSDTKPSAAGTYWVKATVAETADYTGLTAKKSFVIDTVKVAKPEADSTAFTYDGAEKTYTVASNAAYTVSNNTRTLAGSQTVTVALNDKVNYEWSDNTTADLAFTFTVSKAQIAKPEADSTVFTYDGTEKTYAVAVNALYTVSNDKRTNAGSQTVTVALIEADNYEWADGTTADVEFTFTINKAQIAKPEADSTVFTYNKAEQTYAVAVNALYTVSNDKRTNAGSQTVTVALNDIVNYEWADNTTTDVEFTFTINKAVYDMSNVTFADKSIKTDGNAQNIVIGGTLPEGVTVRYEGNGKTEPGVYTVTAIFTGDADNYEAIANKTATLTVLSAGMSESVPGNDTDKPDAIIESDNGLDPNFKLVVEEITTKESVNKVIKKNEVIEKAYGVTLKSDGVVVQPDGTLTVKLLLPETLRGKEFRIISSENGENLQETEYTIEGDYVVFTTDRIGEFSFVSERDDASSLLWLIILLSILLLLEILLAIYKINKDRKDNREIRTYYAIAPFVLAAAFPQAQVTAVIVLAILDVICGAYDAYLYLRRKRVPEEELEDTSEDDARNDM